MKIVIDIPEGMLDELRTCKFPIQDAYRLCAVIENGTPLPKGHGRIGDLDKVANAIYRLAERMRDTNQNADAINGLMGGWAFVYEAETIIEADKEYDVKAITRGNCMACGKELTEGVFFCKECEEKGRTEGTEK